MREKLKERESLVWNCAHQWPSQPWLGKNSIEKGNGWERFSTRLSFSFNFSRIMFARAKSKGRERESLGTRLHPEQVWQIGNPHCQTIKALRCGEIGLHPLQTQLHSALH